MPRPALESAADLEAFFDLSDFAIAATWMHGSVSVQISVLFDAEHMTYDAEAGVVVSTSSPQVMVRASDIPSGAAQGDLVIMGGDHWRVRDMRPDGTGIVTVMLEAD